MTEFSTVYQVLIWAIPAVFAITLHEVGHAMVAKILGDSTAEDMGRLTINPIKHVDFLGTIIIPIAMFYLSGFIFGWAKPVPINWNNLNNKKRDMALVALAGPFANLLMIIFWLFIAIFFVNFSEQGDTTENLFIFYMAWAGIIINFLLIIINLLPVPPLDGSRVLFSVLPSKMASGYIKLERYGLLILAALLVTGILTKIIGPVMAAFQEFIKILVLG